MNEKMFHDRQGLALLQQEEKDGTSDCRVIKVEGAGHWVYCQKPDVCVDEIRKFLKCGNR
jgi:pimeloyl-ACP methyl ester carboxylesterase